MPHIQHTTQPKFPQCAVQLIQWFLVLLPTSWQRVLSQLRWFGVVDVFAVISLRQTFTTGVCHIQLLFHRIFCWLWYISNCKINDSNINLLCNSSVICIQYNIQRYNNCGSVLRVPRSCLQSIQPWCCSPAAICTSIYPLTKPASKDMYC